MNLSILLLIISSGINDALAYTNIRSITFHRTNHPTTFSKLQQSTFPFDEPTNSWQFYCEETMNSMKEFNEKPLIKTESNLTNLELLVNAALLFSAFGFALHTMWNIDHEMSRGKSL